MVLQAATEVGELDGRDRPRDATILSRVQSILARIDEYAVAMNVALVVRRPVGLLAVVVRDRVGPHVLVSLPGLLRVVPPVNRVPVEIDANVVLERRPDRGAGIGGGGIDRDRATSRPAAVVEPVLTAAGALRCDAIELEALRARAPDINRGIERFDVSAGHEDRQRPSRSWIRMNVFRERDDARILGRAGLVGHIEERDRPRQLLPNERHPRVASCPGAGSLVEITAGAVER